MRPFLALASLLIAATATAAIPTSERDALIAIHQSTNGPAWTDRTNWLGAVGTECTWHGVSCDETQSNVIYLELEDNHLDGTLPSAIRNLTKLKVLFVFSNDLRGALPSELGELADLEWIFATRNQFTGNIPASFAGLKKLAALQLDENQLSGALPAHLSGMTALKELGLSSNQFTGANPQSLGQLTNLEVLDLSANRLSGEIPAVLGSFPKLSGCTLATISSPARSRRSSAIWLRSLIYASASISSADRFPRRWVSCTHSNCSALGSISFREWCPTPSAVSPRSSRST